MGTHPRVPMVPRVSCDTARFTGRRVPVPVTGTVSTGTGAVCKLPTRGIPVRNPIDISVGRRDSQDTTIFSILFLFF
jgi:hypothetical protein